MRHLHSLLVLPLLFVLVASVFLGGCAGTGEAGAEDEASVSEVQPDAAQRPGPTPELRGALDYVNAMASALDTYESQRAELQSRLQASTEAALNKLGNDPSPSVVQEATSAWRSDWNDVRSRIEALDLAYTELEVMANKYFNQLNRQSALITRESLRESERERNDEIEQEWTEATEQATADLNALRDLLIVGDDYYVTLLNASVRAGTDENLERLRDISEDGADLTESLERLTTAAEDLVGGRTAEPATATTTDDDEDTMDQDS
jgi:hypothetical protein